MNQLLLLDSRNWLGCLSPLGVFRSLPCNCHQEVPPREPVAGPFISSKTEPAWNINIYTGQ